MVKKADIGGKRLISLAPTAWVQWVTQQPDVIAQEILGSDFQWVSRENDVLVKAYSPTQGEFLILNELQLRYNDKLPVRMRAYAALAEEKYSLPTYPVLINILPPASTVTILDRYEANFMGLQSRQDYQVINLWEVEAAIVFEQSLNALLPFVPVLKNGGETTVVQRALNQLRGDQQLVELESLLAFFASFVLGSEIVRQIMRWDMAVLRESPWYQEILREGERLGEQRGKQEGRQEEGRSLILKQLARRVGALSPETTAQVEALSIEQLEELGEALLDFTQIEELTAWLDQNA
ncbi:MAG: Rpn family recombination-promoting nuclease/putative transposase [Leptolyngbya sp. UWPOB_LEPTO1]|uniref:Rpn family recombination-promoting nuclease/putative transposase n=1 Tax=Leptolyngbya sp. UWPOB_LEPTO1 TaxID=2815653 RepID=UPI001ACAFD2A|nr:Rpn family recombination-promoting nuclease/putative transposase [Leptolyngbya sp. UWPOB_LEPTO1]MBN8562739.1 Rpn family recombination-promoting nuclease/putative transposase [Leptolyngbya sp. UWPOB_LEPTO1]